MPHLGTRLIEFFWYPHTMDMGLPTIYDVWRLALPAATTLCNKDGNLKREVSWARRMSSNIPAFDALDENDFVLLSVDLIKLVDDRLTLAKLIGNLSGRKITGIAVVGEVTAEDIQAADLHNICLLALPHGADLRDIERDIVRLIVEREAQLDRRGKQIYRQLAQHSLENLGLAAIAHALRDIVNKSVVIQDENLVVQSMSLTDLCPFTTDQLEVHLSSRPPLDRWLSKVSLDSKSPPSSKLDLPEKGWARTISAVVIEDRLVGYLSILDAKDNLDALDQLAVERGALVCAVEMAKQRAVFAVEHQLRGDFLDMVLTAGATEGPALNRRATEMGYPLDRQHTVVLFDLCQKATRAWSITASEFRTSLLDSGIQVFLCTYEEKLVALCSTQADMDAKTLILFANQTSNRIKALVPQLHIAIGIGKPGKGLIGLRRSFTQAGEALELIQTLFNGDKVISHGDLGLYHILHHLRDCEDLGEFHNQTLAPLISYDVVHDAQLVRSLETFFNHHGNISQTAEALHLHRNSLIYRLERVKEITDLDLDDADDRFALQLALKLQLFSAASCQ
ncbi:MAG: hypothetical protein E4H27_05190 [Anaerolineales bacterium]|nr:MAG: hypothetical protein E4H27_05190 [Anaerolineales bacterium]